MGELQFKNCQGNYVPADMETRSWSQRQPVGSFVTLQELKKKEHSQRMLSTWWMWMEETAQFMCQRGCTMPRYIDPEGNTHGTRPMNKYDCHELFTMKWLGSDSLGRRLSWKREDNGSGVIADESQRYHALQRHENFCIERGIPITIPNTSQYWELREAENA